MIKIEVQSSEMLSKQGKNGVYYKQQAYAHLIDRDGKPYPYPERMLIFVPKDERGNPIPYKPGNYMLQASSLRVGRFGDLEIGFVNLEPYVSK